MQVDNRVTFYFDTTKPRKNGNLDKSIARYEAMSGKKYWHESIKRVKQKKKGKKTLTVETVVKKKANSKGQWHHVDCDRSNPHPNNMFWCEDAHQHNNLHNQLFQANAEMIKSGVLGFDWSDKKYFVAWKPLADLMRNWRDEGQPNRHCNANLLKDLHSPIKNRSPK